MKKIVCLLLALVMCLGLCCGCCDTIVDDTGVKREIAEGRFALIENYNSGNDYLAYDLKTKIVFYMEPYGHGGYLAPYQIYEDGVIYGAVYENGEIVPIPYAIGITFDMLGLASKYLN